MKFFTAEDFEKQELWAALNSQPINPYDVVLKIIADLANAKLEREGKRVTKWEYVAYDGGANNIVSQWTEAGAADKRRNTHTALLIRVEELKKEEK